MWHNTHSKEFPLSFFSHSNPIFFSTRRKRAICFSLPLFVIHTYTHHHVRALVVYSIIWFVGLLSASLKALCAFFSPPVLLMEFLSVYASVCLINFHLFIQYLFMLLMYGCLLWRFFGRHKQSSAVKWKRVLSLILKWK